MSESAPEAQEGGKASCKCPPKKTCECPKPEDIPTCNCSEDVGCRKTSASSIPSLQYKDCASQVELPWDKIILPAPKTYKLLTVVKEEAQPDNVGAECLATRPVDPIPCPVPEPPPAEEQPQQPEENSEG